MADNKDTIYVDIDDEITALIDKVKVSDARVVALVLPKRASVLQSIVNMKLLKRTADNEKKNLVLITTEAGLMPLAGAVGLYVAKTLNSKPELPPGPNMSGTEPDTVEEDMSLPLDDEETPDLTRTVGSTASVGALSDAVTKPPIGETVPKSEQLETLELDKETDNNKPTYKQSKDAAVVKAKKADKVKVPNFNRFRLVLILGLLAVIALIVLSVFAFVVWPHATIDIKTNASNVNTDVNLTLDTQTTSPNFTSGDIPAKVVSEQKTFTQTVNTTGQKNEGTPATGSVNMTATDCNGTYSGNISFTVPSGTGISYNNLTYITQSDTTMNATKYDFKNNCVDYSAQGPTNITAQSGGSSYNAQISNATVSGYPGVVANGSASGGTDNIVQVVSQTDVNTAASKINASNSATVKQDLIDELKGQGLYPVSVTFTANGNPQITPSPAVGQTSNSVTVTETITYTMFGTEQSYLRQMLQANIRSQTSKDQNIINDGLNDNAFKQNNANGVSDDVTLSTMAEVGPNISIAQIKKQVAGKSPNQIKTLIMSNPDVTNVTIRLSPFWVNAVPSNLSKITVNIAKPTNPA